MNGRSRSMMRVFSVLTVCCMGGSVSCAFDVNDGQAEEGEVSTVNQALSWVGVGSWSCFGDCPDWDVGSAAGQTCFLTAVRGNLSASARVVLDRRADGHYWLDVRNNHANALGADIACIGTVTNRTGEFVQFGNGSTTIPAGTSARRCFLTSIVTNAAPVNAFSSTANFARVTKNIFTGTWSLTNSQASLASAYIGATCVDVPTFVASGTDQADDPGIGSLQIAAADSPINDTACGLTGVGGRFNTNNFNDATELFRADYTPVGGDFKWWLFTDNGKRGWFSCVK